VLHVGINLVFLTPGEQGGMETYARELLPALAAGGGIHLTSFVNLAAADQGGPWEEFGDQVVVPVDARRRTEWVRAEQLLVPLAARRAGVELVHSLASTAPLTGGPVRVTTIHDLNYKMVPDTHFGLRALGMRALVPAAARRSHRIIVDAASTRDDLARHLRVDPTKVDVVPLAAGIPVPEIATSASDLREALKLDSRPVVLSPSAKRPHKNLERLIRALGAIPVDRRPMLVVPGYPTPYEQILRDLAVEMGVFDDVRLPGWLRPEDMEGLYALATCVVFPSLYEGFGLPVLEAMARGVPVACSDRASLPEVTGTAALLFDPEDERAIRDSLERLLSDPDLRADLATQGCARARRFSWEATAEQTVAAYRRALEGAV